MTVMLNSRSWIFAFETLTVYGVFFCPCLSVFELSLVQQYHHFPLISVLSFTSVQFPMTLHALTHSLHFNEYNQYKLIKSLLPLDSKHHYSHAQPHITPLSSPNPAFLTWVATQSPHRPQPHQP